MEVYSYVPPGVPNSVFEKDVAAPTVARRKAKQYARESDGEVPADGLPWVAATHHLNSPRLLTASDPRSPTPPGFLGELFPPQATLLHAICALERAPALSLAPPSYHVPWLQNLSDRLETRCVRISERFSFGKTVLALALICAQRVPRRLPALAPLATFPVTGDVYRATNLLGVAPQRDPCTGVRYQGALPELTVRYARLLEVTIVAAASSVISQWEDNARRFTRLRFFTIDGVRALREFERLFRGGKLAEIDIVFVKVGRAAANFVVKGEPSLGDTKSRSILQAVARVLDGVPVARLIIDDFDTLKLCCDDCFVPALFTLLISATRRQVQTHFNLHSGDSAADFCRKNMTTNVQISAAALDEVTNKVCSLHCDPAYVAAYIGSTSIAFRRIFVRGGRAAAILRNLDASDEVIEMLNADAIKSAATKLGFAAASVGDIIRRVVGAHVFKLRAAVRIFARLERVRAELKAACGDPETDSSRISELRAAIKKGSDGDVAKALAAVSGGGEKVYQALDSLAEWAAEEEEKHGKALARMRENVRQEICQCCKAPFDVEGAPAYILANCCQAVICEVCATMPRGNDRGFIRRCVNCASSVAHPAGLIRVGAELDLAEALSDEAVIELDSDAAAPDAEGGGKADAAPARGRATPADFQNPKLRALAQLVLGEPIDCLSDAPAPPFVEGLIDASRNSPWPADLPKKFLVFSSHTETTAELSAGFELLGIPFAILRGTRAQKDAAVEKLRSEVGVLFVTAPKDCSGLHLPFVSHIVFYHLVLDRNVEAQVAARGQRLGRLHNLEIVGLVNQQESVHLANLPPKV